MVLWQLTALHTCLHCSAASVSRPSAVLSRELACVFVQSQNLPQERQYPSCQLCRSWISSVRSISVSSFCRHRERGVWQRFRWWVVCSSKTFSDRCAGYNRGTRLVRRTIPDSVKYMGRSRCQARTHNCATFACKYSQFCCIMFFKLLAALVRVQGKS